MILSQEVHFSKYDLGGTILIIFGQMHFLLISENEFLHQIKRDGITSFLDFMIGPMKETGCGPASVSFEEASCCPSARDVCDTGLCSHRCLGPHKAWPQMRRRNACVCELASLAASSMV